MKRKMANFRKEWQNSRLHICNVSIVLVQDLNRHLRNLANARLEPENNGRLRRAFTFNGVQKLAILPWGAGSGAYLIK